MLEGRRNFEPRAPEQLIHCLCTYLVPTLVSVGIRSRLRSVDEDKSQLDCIDSGSFFRKLEGDAVVVVTVLSRIEYSAWPIAVSHKGRIP